jgi:hypothetical protein
VRKTRTPTFICLQKLSERRVSAFSKKLCVKRTTLLSRANRRYTILPEAYDANIVVKSIGEDQAGFWFISGKDHGEISQSTETTEYLVGVFACRRVGVLERLCACALVRLSA